MIEGTYMGRFEVMRPFHLGDEIVSVHEIVELSDSTLISSLLACGRITPADGATAARVRKPNPWFEPKPPSMFQRRVQSQGN